LCQAGCFGKYIKQDILPIKLNIILLVVKPKIKMQNQERSTQIKDLVWGLSCQGTKIIPIDIIKQHPLIMWGNNGVGGRFAKKLFNYTSIQRTKTQTHSENDFDEIPKEILELFSKEFKKGNGIKGIWVHSFRTNTEKRPIRKDIKKTISKKSCVICASKTEIVCDHKNDLYNDERVLNEKTQELSDFQPLCNHCNLQKRQISKDEYNNQKIYSAKNIERLGLYEFEFPFEKYAFDKNDIKCKAGSYWYDPVEFEKKIYYYSIYTIPIIKMVKKSKKFALIG
jgi:hypothetical protein